MSRVDELIPGDLVTEPALGMSAVFVARTAHPIWPGLQLVIWRMSDGSWSIDALAAIQHLGGEVSPATDIDRTERLREALLNDTAQPEGLTTTPDTSDRQVQQVRPFSELTDTGLLWLINRVVFHPRGYALTLDIDSDTGLATGWMLQGTGVEVWTYPTAVDEAKFITAQDTLLRAATPQET